MNQNGPTQLNFDASTVDPTFGASSFFPVSDDKGHLVCVVADNGFKPASTGKGYFLELMLRAQEGPLAGTEAPLRLNLQHENPNAVSAAYAQLSAIAHVVGSLRVTTTMDIMNKPFRVVSELQDKTKPDGYTQLANNGIRDVNGNKPGKAGQGPQQAQTAPQAPQQPQQPQQMQQPSGQAPQGGWQQPQGGQPQQPPQNWQQPGAGGGQPQNGGQAPNWQQPGTGGAPQQPGGAPQNWQGGGGAPGGAPSWSQ